MPIVDVNVAKTQLSWLIDHAAAGTEIVIARAGKPGARLVPLTRRRAKRKLGMLAGRMRVPDDFDAPLPHSVVDRFEGR